MSSRLNSHGQSLVEVALLFPMIILMLAFMLQLLLMIHMHMKLHRTALYMAEQMSFGVNKPTVIGMALLDYTKTLRWGLPIPRPKVEPLSSMRRYPGVQTLNHTNCLAIGDITFPLMGSWFASVGIQPIILKAHEELPCEPTGMAEPS